jgi:hypothetical protein
MVAGFIGGIVAAGAVAGEVGTIFTPGARIRQVILPAHPESDTCICMMGILWVNCNSPKFDPLLVIRLDLDI